MTPSPSLPTTPTAWLGVVAAAHVRRALALGIAQINHGKRHNLARMSAGDWLVYYSPTVELGGTEKLQAFTAIGRITDDDIYRAVDGDFHPYRRRVDYLTEAHETPIAPLKPHLDLTAAPDWGYQLRMGLVPLSGDDLDRIRAAMLAEAHPGGETPIATGPES